MKALSAFHTPGRALSESSGACAGSSKKRDPMPYNDIQGTLIAHADDVAISFQDKWGSAVVGDPKHDDIHGWHIEVIGLLGDIQMDTVRIYADGSREMVV